MTSWQPQEPSERSAVVDLSAVWHNVVRLTQLARGRKLIAVVKADAYGHGAPEVARTALAAGAHMLGTAHVSEAVALRDAGITAPVIAWLHTMSTDFDEALYRDVRLGVSGWEFDAVLQAARRTGTTAVVHLKLDSGLGRNGATPEQWLELVARAARAQQEGLLTVEGVFTHLAVADDPGRPETQEQLDALNEAVRTARGAGLAPSLVHAANTPGLLSAEQLADPDSMLRDAVRVGLGLYGLSPFEDRTPQDFGLIPAMTLRARVANVKAVPRDSGVSYGLSYRTARDTHLALIPLGYADGVPRVATGAPVRIGGRVYPVVGRIAMDQCVVDLALGRTVTPEGVPAGQPVLDEAVDPLVHVGDEAVLFGAGDHPSVTEWADAAGTINYEVVTRISPRVPREYTSHSHLTLGDVTVSRSASALAAHSLPQDPRPTRVSGGEAFEQPNWTLTLHPGGAEDTRGIAERLAPHLHAGDLVMLNGELGAGKTTFTQGLGHGLGVREGIISPTFVLSRRHPNLPDGPRPGGPDLVHVDAYRLDTAADIDTIDLEDTLDTCVTVVEWGTSKVEHLSDSRLVVDFVRPQGVLPAVGEHPAAPALSYQQHGGEVEGDHDGDVVDGAVAQALRALTDEWDGEEQDGDEPRTLILRGYGPRWSDRLDL
ncbi:alanine racemase [Kocuria salsicia]|uniref:alanine racemase n=1 Tax=Kocuria salsicia TaxID=664639 RepID=UPI0034041AB3